MKRFLIIGLVFVTFLIIVLYRYDVLGTSSKETQTVSPPSTIAPIPSIEPSEIYSSDASMKLVLKKEKSGDSFAYSLYAVNNSTNDEKLIYQKILKSTDFIEVDPNSWSPDNELIFVNQKKADISTTLVFKASGESFRENQQFLDIAFWLKSRKIEYGLDEVTGWESPALLRVVTSTAGAKGPTYWFDVATQSFMMPARR